MPRKKAAPKTPAAKPAYDWIAPDLRPLAVPIGQLKLDPANARRHDAANIAAIGASLGRFGQVKPIVVNRKTNVIVAGNGAHQAAENLGWSHLAVVWVEHDPADHSQFSIADNRTAELAEWDDAKLEQLLIEFRQEAPDLYEELLLDRLREEEEEEPDEEEDEPDSEGQMEGLEYRLIVDCQSEEHQAELLARFEKEGIICRALIS